MWPDPGEALSRTIDAEAAVADLYAEALRRWAPDARAAALPTLSGPTYGMAAATLPPDPDALAQTQTAWDAHAEEVILAGLLALWAVTYVEAAAGLGIALPLLAADAVLSSGKGADVLDDVAVSIITRTTDATTAEVRDWAARVQADTGARATVADFIDTQRPAIAAVPGMVQQELAAAVRTAEFPTTGGVAGSIEDQRKAAALALEPSSPEMRDLARREGYQAAGVMNHAVVAAAEQSPDAEELEKFWLATLDGKTRPTHWAAEGQRVPLAGKFTVGGEQMDHPGDESASPAEWKNCRCRLGILTKDEALPDEVDRHTERLDGRDSVAINRDGRTQAEEIERRRDAGNIRARDDEDGIGRVASGGWAAPSEQEHHMPKPSDLAKNADLAKKVGAGMLFAAAEADANSETFQTFSGVIGKLGVATSDRRILAPDIELTFREFPLPVAWCEKAGYGHNDSYTVGVMEGAHMAGEDVVVDSGYFLNDIGDDSMCATAMNQAVHRVSAPSLDLAAAEYIFSDENGKEIEGDLYDWWEENGEPYTYFTKAEVTGFTLVQTPAFDGIDIVLGERETRDVAIAASMVADLELKAYDPELFSDPKLTRPTAPTMNNTTGRIYGHLAEFGHPYRGGGGELTPRNHNDYANFHTSQVLLSNGKQLSVGRLTVKGGHASTQPGVTAATARAHYDNVCTAFGLVRVGEDRFGIWFSGVPAPGVDPDTFQMGMTAPLSGDWRDEGRGLDMVGAHAVNSPGFPIYSAATGPDGREVALVASLGPSRKSKKSGGGFTLDRESLKTLLTEVVETVDQRRAAVDAALARQSRATAALSRAQQTVGDPPPELTPNERAAQLLAKVGQ